jgi:hypothetical protein
MAKYFNKNGEEYNLEEIEAAALANSKSVEDVIADNELIMQEDEEQIDALGKEDGVVAKEPPAAPVQKSGSPSKNTLSASNGKKKYPWDPTNKPNTKVSSLANFKTGKETKETVEKNVAKIIKKSPNKNEEEAFSILQAADRMDADISEIVYDDYKLDDLTFKTKEARKQSDIANKKYEVQKALDQETYRKDFEIANPDKIAPWAFEGDEEDVAVKLAPVLESMGLETVSSGMGNQITVKVLDYENPKFGTVNESASFDLEDFKKDRTGFIDKFNKQINLMKDTQYVKKVKNRAQGSFNAFQKQFGLDEDKRGFDEIENEINKERLKEFTGLKTKFGALLPKGYFKGDDKKYADYVSYISKGTLIDKDIEDIAFYKYKNKLFDGRTLEQETKIYKEEVADELLREKFSKTLFGKQEGAYEGFKAKNLQNTFKEIKEPSVFDLVDHRSKNKAKDIDGKIQDFVSFELSRNKSANKLGNILTSDLRVLQREYEKGLIKNSKDLKNKEIQYTTDASNFEKELKTFKANSDKLMDQPLRTAEEVDALKLNYLDLLSKQEKLDKAKENLQISGLSLTKEANLAPVALTNFSKNYDRLSELAIGFKDLGTKLAIGAADLTKYQSRIGSASYLPEFSKYSMNLLDGFEKEKQKVQKNLKVDEIRSAQDLGKWVAGSTAQTLPSLAMAFTGEFALPLFFLSGYGEATSKIELEKQEVIENITEAKNQIMLLDPAKDQIKINELNTIIEQEGSKISMGEGSEMAYKLLYGTAEAAFELVTIGLLKNLKAGIKQLPKQAIRNGFTGILKEGGSEFATTVSQNFGDIYIKGESEKSLFEGGLESFAQGGLMGLGFSSAAGVGVLKRAVASELATRKDILQSKELVKRIVELTGNKSFMVDQNISVDQLTENLHPKIKEEVTSLVNQIAEIDNNILDKLNYEYSAGNLLEVGRINARIRQINKSVQEISADPNLSLAQVTELKKSYEKDFNELNEQRQEILSKGDGNVKTELAKQFTFSALEFYNDRVTLERNKVIFSLANQFNGLTEDEKADYELKAMAIQENDNESNPLYTGNNVPTAVELYIQDKTREILNKKREVMQRFISEQGIEDDVDIKTFDITEGKSLNDIVNEAANVFAEVNGLSNNSVQVKEFKEGLKDGTIDGLILNDNKTIIEFVPNAAKNGRVSLLAHEIGHHEITKVFGNEKTGEAFLRFIEKNYPSSYIKIKARLDENKNFIEGTETLKPEATQEPFTYFIDTLADNNAIPDKKVLAQVAAFLDSKQKVISFTNMLGQNDAAMFNYLIDFTNKTYFNKGGKMPSKNYIVGTDQESDTPNVTRASRSIEERMDKLDLQLSNNEIDFEKYEADMKKLEQEEFEQYKKTYEEEKKVVKKEPVKKETVKKEPTEVSEAATKAKAKLDAIGNDPKGFNPNNPAIYDELDKMVKVKSRNYKTSNGTIIDLTNKNKGGLDGFSMEEMTSYVTMSMLPYIQKFDPSKNDSLYGYINAQLANRMKAALKSGQVADVVFTEDVTEMTKLSNEEVEVKSISLPERKRFQNILESGVFSPDVIESVQAKMMPLVRTLESKFNEKTTLNKTVSPLIREIKNYIGTQADIDIKKAMGGKEDQVLQNWLITNKKTVLENLPTTWLMGKDNGKTVSGGMPFAIQKQVNGRWLNYPDWIGKKVDRESVSTDLAGRTSGHELVRRLPEVNKNVSVEEFLSAIIDLKNGDVIRGRKESLAKVMSEELTLDILIDDFLNDGPLFQLFVKNQEAKGILRDDIIINDIVRQSERGNAKFSLTQQDFDSIRINSLEIAERIQDIDNINSTSIAQALTEIGWEENRIAIVAKALAGPLSRNRKFFGEDEFLENTATYLQGFENEKDYDERMYQVFNTKRRVATIFKGTTGKRTVEMLRKKNAWFGKAVIKKYGQEKGLQLLKSFWSPTVVNSDKDGVKIYNNVKEFNDFLEDIQISLQGRKNLSKKSTINNVINASDIKAEFRRPNSAFENMFNGEFDPKKDIKKTNAAKDFLIFTAEWWANSMKNKESVYSAAMFTMLFKDKHSLGKTAAPVVGVIKDGEFKPEAYIFEHTVPGRHIAYLLAKKIYLKDNSMSYEDIFNDYNVLIVPEKISIALDASGVKDMVAPFHYFPFIKKNTFTRYDAQSVRGLINNNIQLYQINKVNTANEKAATNNLNQAKKSISISTVSDFINANNLKRIDAETSFDVLNDLNKEIENYWGIVPNDVIVKMGRAVDYAFDVIEDRENEGGPLMAAVNNALNLETVKFAEKQLNQFIDNNKPKETMYSKTLDFEFNDILERNTGVAAFTKVSDVVAKRTGIKKTTLSFFVPPSADDFRGLTTYMFAGKGKQGEQDQEFFDKNLTIPYVKGINTLDSVRQSIRKEYKMLLDNFPEIKKKLEKLTPDKGFTYDQAVRVYLWSSAGKEVPGLSRTDKNKLLYFVKQNPDLLAFANALSITGRQDGGWIDPSTTWDSETIISDLHNITEGAGRKRYLEEFIENADAIFTKENLNKIQSIYGTNVREALEDSLYRMKNGKNRPEGTDRVTNTWMNWINGSTAAIMFFNTRSALLQTISAINFLNWNDNNPYMAGKAFLNQKQYWSDFAMIINSDKLKERRSGLKADVTQAEIANAANSTKNKFNGVISYLQKIGFTPTQAADSFSIAVSGATFYRNRVNTYLKAGDTVEVAEEKAFNDFSIITDQSMQSADPMYVSKQQTTALGRLILAFGNTPMQYNRLIKKATLDLANKRGDWKTNISKIIYYGALQNMLFSFLQSALFIPLGYDDEEEPDLSKMTKEQIKEYEKLKKKGEDKITNMINGMADTLLRGSGVYGAAIATVKNTAMEYFKQEEKEMFADHAYTVLALTSVSPPVSSKARKLYGAIRISKFEKDVIAERGWEITKDGKLNLAPNYRIAGNIAVATTNLPLDRVVEKVNNMSEVMDSRNTALQRTALALGWKDWELNVKNEENETIKATAKVKRKEEGIEKAVETRKANKEAEKEKFKKLSIQEKIAFRLKKAKEKRDKRIKKRKMG